MNYCTKGQWVAIATTGQCGIVHAIISRRNHKKDGRVLIQCGADGPFIASDMNTLRELTQKEIDIEEGVRFHED